jgi:DNA-binding PadR family transcriptional regulator
MSERSLLPGEYAVLGLLTLRPMHGYDMARCFQEELAEVAPLEQSLLYAYVKNLERRGLVEWAEERVGLRPPRKVYFLTEEGEQAAWAWLRRPVERMRDVRLELLIKLFILHGRHASLERELLAEQIATCENYRARIAEQVASRTGFARLVAGSRLSAAEATLKWLSEYARELEGQPAR